MQSIAQTVCRHSPAEEDDQAKKEMMSATRTVSYTHLLALHLQLQLVAALFHRLLDAGGVDAAITDQALQRHAGNLAAGLILSLIHIYSA